MAHGGDFNEIIKHEEKHGGNLRLEHQLQLFHNLLDCCQLQDLRYDGNIFTWCNGREGCSSINERLDRFVANKEWQELYPHW